MDIEDTIPASVSTWSMSISNHVWSSRRDHVLDDSCKMSEESVLQSLASVPLQSLVLEEKVKIFCRTWGCSHNSSDSEMMLGLLCEAGFQIINDENEADVWILNSCTAKTPSEYQLRHKIEQGIVSNKIIVVAGCVPEAEPSLLLDKKGKISIVGVDYIDKIVEIVMLTLNGVHVFANKSNNTFAKTNKSTLVINLPRLRKNRFIEILPISTGCLHNCTYCKTKLARGHLQSNREIDLVERCKKAFEEGVKEIWLTSEDLGAYGYDLRGNGSNIVKLVRSILKVTPSDCMIRLGMTNPTYIWDYMEENIVDAARRSIERIYIATDIICGYPTETDEDFDCTLELLQLNQFPSVFINQYYQRPGTLASLLPQLSSVDKKQRTKAATNTFKSYDYYADRIGDKYRILLTETSRNGKFLIGHNKFYEQVLLPVTSGAQLGTWVEVKIVASTKFSMTGESVQSRNQTYVLNKGTIIFGITTLFTALMVAVVSSIIFKRS